MKRALALLLPALALAAGCSQTGVQGTSLGSRFQGLEEAVAVSPTTVRLQWSLDSNYKEYRVYMNGSTSPMKSENFSRTDITGLSPDTSYVFQVTGIKNDGTEDLIGGTRTVQTLKNFLGLTAGGVSAKDGLSTAVNISWNMNSPLTTFKIYMRKKTGSWKFDAPVASVRNSNTVPVTGLTSGEEYCFYVRATYDDLSFEPAATDSATINASAPCKQMTSELANTPSISVSSVVPGEFPWFLSANGDPSYTTEVFRLGDDVRVASVNGNGPFRSFVKMSEDESNYYAVVTDPARALKSRVKVDLNGLRNRAASKVRALNESGPRSAIFPPLINGGFGEQRFGAKIVRGDFNCDGLPDVAVAMPTATIAPTPRHFSQGGAIVVYYSYQAPLGSCLDDNDVPVPCPIELKTDVAPSPANRYPDPVLIYYDPTTKSGVQMGVNLSVGNFNGDCYERHDTFPRSGSCNDLYRTFQASVVGPPAHTHNIKDIRSCDDLVIGTTDNAFYVIYGNPNEGLVAGSGASTAGNNEFTCDPTSNTCRPVQMSAPSGYSTGSSGQFGSAFAVGDFNNDGYDDLAVRAVLNSNQAPEILVYRGDSQGLYPQGTTGQHARISLTATSSLASNAYSTPTDTLADSGFGAAMAGVPNSRLCVNGQPAGAVYRPSQPAARRGYDLTKCADLAIGAPSRASSRGSVFTCKAVQPTTGDKQQITDWTCAEHWPQLYDGSVWNDLPAGSQYGASLLGAANLNGYPIQNIKSNPSSPSQELPNVGGALLVGAPRAPVTSNGTTYTSAGRIFAYYVTPTATGSATLGGIQPVLGLSGSHRIDAENQVACNSLNAIVDPAHLVFPGAYRCNHQSLTMSPPASNAQFGKAMGLVPLYDSPNLGESSAQMLAVAAPYRNASKPNGGGTISAGGSVFLFRSDTSTFGKEGVNQITQAQRSYGQETNPSCTSNCTWYSGGLSPFGGTIFSNGTVSDSANFGLGGIVGGDFDSDGLGDVMVSAPGNKFPTPENGGLYVYSSAGGYSPTEDAPDLTLNPNLALEGNYQFEQAKVIGDINGDGYDDVVAHIRSSGVWRLVVYYGSPSGLITSPAPSRTAAGTQPLLIELSSDSSLGVTFFPAGDINKDGYKDLIAFGTGGVYVYYGSSAGLVVTPDPAVAPIGKGPLRFAIPGGDVSFDTRWKLGGNASVDHIVNGAYSDSVQGVVVGDFNNDDVDDIAIRVATSVTPPLPHGNLSFIGGSDNSTRQTGRVFVIYGEEGKGPQVNRQTGQLNFHDSGGGIGDIVVEEPCSVLPPYKCKVQILGPPDTRQTDGFGFSLAVLRQPGPEKTDQLYIGDPSVDGRKGNVYVFETTRAGVVSDKLQTLVGRSSTTEGFGAWLAAVGDVNGDTFGDLAVGMAAYSANAANSFYMFYGANLGGKIGFFGATDIDSVNYWTPTIAQNQEHASPSSPRPQFIRPASGLKISDRFGSGLTALGDFNNDGYADVAVNIPTADSTVRGNQPGTGSVIIYFGGPNGLRATSLPTRYPRCYAGANPICEPLQLFLPEAVDNETSSINPFSAGDINKDGLPDFVIGGVGRDLSVQGSRTATSTGVLYILY